MSIIPRWEVMTDEAKALTKSFCLAAGFLLITFWLVRTLIPWIIFGFLAYLSLKCFSRNH